LNSIDSLQELIQQLSESFKDNYNSVLQNFLIDKQSFSKFEHWSEEKYIRNGIYKDERFEIILLCWEKGQKTPIHCHGGEECWVYLLKGEIEEVFYVKDGQGNPIKTTSKKLHVSNSSYINDTIGFHSMRNSFDGRSLSLHIYAKPILECRFYDENEQEFKKKKMVYDTFNEEYYSVPKALV